MMIWLVIKFKKKKKNLSCLRQRVSLAHNNLQFGIHKSEGSWQLAGASSDCECIAYIAPSDGSNECKSIMRVNKTCSCYDNIENPIFQNILTSNV